MVDVEVCATDASCPYSYENPVFLPKMGNLPLFHREYPRPGHHHGFHPLTS
jgi:hypothetical protein